MFPYVHSSIVHNIQNIEYQSIDGWIKKIHTHTRWNTKKKKKEEEEELMPFAATWMQPKISISEVNQKDQHHMISFICGI